MNENAEKNENNDLRGEEASGNSECHEEDSDGESRTPLPATDLRNAAYVILFIAAVFVVNAMETGSYRTPWPVAIIVSLAGLGLLGYSQMIAKKEKA